MNTERMEHFKSELSDELAGKLPVLRNMARTFATDAVEQLKKDDNVFELTEDEQRMLSAYRRHRQRSTEPFSWRAPPSEGLVLATKETSLLLDPRECPEVIDQ